MEEVEIPEVGVDKQAEAAHEKAQEEKHRVPWLRGLAVSSACFAVIAAIASLKSGRCANEALLRQSKATDQWAYYQAIDVFQSVSGFAGCSRSPSVVGLAPWRAPCPSPD